MKKAMQRNSRRIKEALDIVLLVSLFAVFLLAAGYILVAGIESFGAAISS